MPTSLLEGYLSTIGGGRPATVPSLRTSVEDFVRRHISTFSYRDHVKGLLVGRVQSGKTSQVLGTIAAAADPPIEFKFFLLLTPDNTFIHKQTLERAISGLPGFVVCDESDDGKFVTNRFKLPTLLVLKKNSRVLGTWRTIIGGTSRARTEPVMIFDDEGDAASLNTKVNKAEISTINNHLSALGSLSPSSIYVQVTATPQAILLQTTASAWRPDFVYILEPGSGYLGGPFFYTAGSPVLRSISESEGGGLPARADLPEGLRRAVLTFLATGICRVRLQGEGVNNLLIHPTLAVADHRHVARMTRDFLDLVASDYAKGAASLRMMMGDVCDDLRGTDPVFPDVASVYSELGAILPQVNLIVINMYTPPGVSYDKGLNIIIGGNSLGRGLTFPGLNTVYYTRQARTPQLDTVWQHSRVFGYDRERNLCRVFLPPSLQNLYREFNDANETLLHTLAVRGIDGITVMSPPGTRATRTSVVDRSALDVIVGGVNYFPSYPKKDNCLTIDRLVGTSDGESIIDAADARRILGLIRVEAAETMNPKRFGKCLESLEAGGRRQVTLMVRTNRNITKGTGTLLSPTDRAASDARTTETVLIMYRLNGGKPEGWDGSPLWVPNIKFPDDCIFYATD